MCQQLIGHMGHVKETTVIWHLCSYSFCQGWKSFRSTAVCITIFFFCCFKLLNIRYGIEINGDLIADLSNIFESFLPQLLSYPNPVDPLNGDAAALYLHKPEQYKAKIQEYIKKYATEEALKDQEEMSSSSESSISDFSEDEAQDMELWHKKIW